MKIALSSTGKDLNSDLDPRFGRCANFLIVNMDDMTFETFENESQSLGGGAGIQAAQFVAAKGASVVITGNLGPNASTTLNAADIKVFLVGGGLISDIIERYKKGELSSADKPTVADHYGMGSGGDQAMSQGRGGGTGRGMGGGGGGRGMGKGRGMGMQQMGQTPGSGGPEISQGNNPEDLKEEARLLREKLDSIQSRIDNLEKK